MRISSSNTEGGGTWDVQSEEDNVSAGGITDAGRGVGQATGTNVNGVCGSLNSGTGEESKSGEEKHVYSAACETKRGLELESGRGG